VIATARRGFDPVAFDPGADLLPLVTGLEVLALVGMVDPPRPTARASIATAAKAGIRVRMITGDYAVTAAAVAGQLGIDGTVLTGAEFGAMGDQEALNKINDIGVITRVSPEHKVRLVEVLRRQGQIVAMTGDGVNDAPAVKKADIGIAMGTGTEVNQEAAVMILTDDNFSTIVKAVELGRGLYDNLARYIRYQVAGLFGYIATFLGASIFDLAGGVPLLPLQTLWVSFTTLSLQSVGLGYSKPAAGLMDRPPQPPGRPADPDPRAHRLAFLRRPADGGRHTLGLISWADQAHGLAVARTMGMVTSRCSCCSSPSSARTNGTRRSPSPPSPTGRSVSRPARPSSCFLLLVLSTALAALVAPGDLPQRQGLAFTGPGGDGHLDGPVGEVVAAVAAVIPGPGHHGERVVVQAGDVLAGLVLAVGEQPEPGGDDVREQVRGPAAPVKAQHRLGALAAHRPQVREQVFDLGGKRRPGGRMRGILMLPKCCG